MSGSYKQRTDREREDVTREEEKRKEEKGRRNNGQEDRDKLTVVPWISLFPWISWIYFYTLCRTFHVHPVKAGAPCLACLHMCSASLPQLTRSFAQFMHDIVRGWEPFTSLLLSSSSSPLLHEPSGGLSSGQTLKPAPAPLLPPSLPPSHLHQSPPSVTPQGQQSGWQRRTEWQRKLCRLTLRQRGLCWPLHPAQEYQALGTALQNLGRYLQRRTQVDAAKPGPNTNHWNTGRVVSFSGLLKRRGFHNSCTLCCVPSSLRAGES